MTEILTRPERYVDETMTRRKIGIVMRCGGCLVCTHRVEGWGNVGCDHGRSYPLCIKTPGKGFEPDHVAINRGRP